MSESMVMVQWADLTGGGFRRHDVGPAVPREYWAAAEQLLQGDLSQPPEGIRSTVVHPVWTLRRVQVRGQNVWCFVVQGRRGPFGVAGSCRFAFAPEPMSAWDAWHAGRATAAAEYEVSDENDLPSSFADVLSDVLGGIVLGQQAIPIEVPPQVAAIVIPRVLGVLPEATAQRWSWSTCTLKRPESAERRVVSGQWPEEFRRSDPHRGRVVDRLFRRGPAAQTEVKRCLATDEAIAGFEWLVTSAVSNERPEPELLAYRDFGQMIIDFGHERRPPDLRHVPARMRTERGRATLHGHVDLVTAWAAQHPQDAHAELPAVDDPVLRAALLHGLVGAQSNTSENLLGLPDAANPGVTAANEALARELAAGYSPGDLREVIRQWSGPAGVLGRPDDLAAARDWFYRLGFSVNTDPGLFQPRPHFVIDAINEQHALTKPAMTEVQLAASRLPFLEQLIDQLAPLPAREAGTLLVFAVQDCAKLRESDLLALRGIAHQLTARALQVTDSASWEPWVDEMLDRIQQRQRHPEEARSSMYGAVSALMERDAAAPHEPLLHRCRMIGTDKHAPGPVAEVVEFARRRLGGTFSNSPADPAVAQGAVYASGRRHWSRTAVGGLNRAFPARIRGYVAVGLASALVAGAATEIARSAPQESNPPAVASPASVETRTAPQAVDPLRISLGGPTPGPADQALVDERRFREWYDQATTGTPAAVLLVVYGESAGAPGVRGRAHRLRDRLTVVLGGVPVEVFVALATGQRDETVGSLRALVYFSR